MDETGACKFPADKLDAVLENVTALQKEEEKKIAPWRRQAQRRRYARFSAGTATAKSARIVSGLSWRRSSL